MASYNTCDQCDKNLYSDDADLCYRCKAKQEPPEIAKELVGKNAKHPSKDLQGKVTEALGTGEVVIEYPGRIGEVSVVAEKLHQGTADWEVEA